MTVTILAKYKIFTKSVIIALFFFLTNNAESQGLTITYTPITKEKRDEIIKNGKGEKALEWDSVCIVMQIQYSPSEKFFLNKKSECCESLPRFTRSTGCLYHGFEATDSNFVAIFESSSSIIHTIHYRKKRFHVFNDSQIKEILNNYHFGIMKGALMLTGKYKTNISVAEIQKEMNYLPTDYLDNNFNADTVVSYKIPLREGESFRKTFTYCDLLILTKKDLGCIALYCFYTKEGVEKRDEYIRELGQMIKYK